MKRIMTALPLCLLLLLPVSAKSQDIVATWRHQNGNSMKLAMRGATLIRMDTGKDNYILANGNKVYMVSMNNGQWTAMDMDLLAGMMSRFGIQAGTNSQATETYQSDFKNTGRSETVAGYQGSVYLAETKDESGEVVDRSEVVFSKHKDVVLASQAWILIATRLGDIVGTQTSQTIEKATKQAGYGGMLRVAEMALVKIEKPALSAAFFDLPEGAQIMDMDAMPAQGMNSN